MIYTAHQRSWKTHVQGSKSATSILNLRHYMHFMTLKIQGAYNRLYQKHWTYVQYSVVKVLVL